MLLNSYSDSSAGNTGAGVRSYTLVNATASPLLRLGKNVLQSPQGEVVADQDDATPTTASDQAEGERRRLKVQVPVYCDDFRFEFAIDGVITSWNKDEFQQRVANIQRVVELIKLVEDPSLTNDGAEEREIELAVRMVGCGIQKQFQLTHVYWA